MPDLKFRIIAENLAKKGVDAATQQLGRLRQTTESVSSKIKGFTSKIVSGFGKIGLAAMGIRAAFDTVKGVAMKFWSTIQAAFKFESFTVQFAILFKDLKRAKQHMADLLEFSASTPFQIEGIAKASRQLHLFSGGVMGGAHSLRMVGDAAAATGNQIDEVATWFGRAYAAIAAGKPFGEAAQRLSELGVLSVSARNKMEDLQASGATTTEIFNVLKGEFENFSGGMEKASQTGDGLVSTLKDNVNLTLAAVGEQFQDLAKNKIKDLIDWLGVLRDSNAIQEWADEVRGWMQSLNPVIESVKAKFGEIVRNIKLAAGFLGAFFNKSKEGMSLRERIITSAEEAGQSYMQHESKAAKAEKQEKRQEQAEANRAAVVKKQDEQKAREEAAITKQLEESQAKIDEKTLKEAEQAKNKEEAKKQERIAQARARLDERTEREAYNKLSNPEKLKYTSNKIANLQQQINSTDDEEKQIQLQNDLLDAQSEHDALQKFATSSPSAGISAAAPAPRKHKTINPADVLAEMQARANEAKLITSRNLIPNAQNIGSALAGTSALKPAQVASHDPSTDIALNTRETVTILRKIEQQGFGLAS